MFEENRILISHSRSFLVIQKFDPLWAREVPEAIAWRMHFSHQILCGKKYWEVPSLKIIGCDVLFYGRANYSKL